METPRYYQTRLVLAGLSLGVILALLIWPATRWLVRSQLALAIPVPSSVAPWSIGAQAGVQTAQQRYHDTAIGHPNDFALQFADAVVVAPTNGSLTSDVKIRRLRELTRRFPDRPTLYAAILRFATRDQVRIERDMPEQLAAFDRYAAEGERLDPDNAYFPFMRTIGLFAAHRDADALAALQRAAHEPNWTEYYNDEIEGDWKLQEEAFGTVGALPRMAFAASILFPHYSQLRAASRVAVAKAVEAEQAGRIEEGLTIREAVRQCGGLMRVQSTSAIGSLVGISINKIAMIRPGGAPPIPDTLSGAGEQRVRDYDAYLQRIGRTEKTAFEDAAAAGVRSREILKTAVHSPFYDTPKQLAAYWLADIILLSNVLWLLALAGGAALLAHWRPFRAGQGLPSSMRLGAALGLVAGALLAGAGILYKACPTSYLFLSGVLLSTLLVGALPGAKGSARAGRMKAFGLGLVGAALLCSAFVWQVGGSIEPVAQMMSGLGGEGDAPIAPRVAALSVGFASALPLLTLLTLGLLSLGWHVPLSVGMVRGLRGCALPLACGLLLVYGMLVPMTLRQETVLDAGMKRWVQHEGQFMAEMIGKHWPGPTR